MHAPDSPFLAAPQSAMPQILWPAILNPAQEQVLALMYQLDRTQWWPAAHIEARQFEQLGKLVEFAREFVPFYRERLAPIAKARRIDARAWRDVPLLTRRDIQTDAGRLQAMKLPKAHHPVKPVSTSGSTGAPITVLASAVTSLFFRALNLRTHLWHLRDLQGDFAFIRYLRKGKHATETSSWSSIFPTGNSHGLDVFAPVDEQIRWLRAKAPRVLMTYPSNLEQLLHAVRDGRVRLPSLQQVRTFGEALPDTLRVLCDSVLGIPLVDQYSSMELGLIAIQCPRFPHYHVQAENVYVEILNDAGQPCAPGEIGRVVVTDLHNFASPLLRYELGDLAEPGEPCPCGRGLPVINRVLGRVRGMMAMRDGTRRWPRGYSGLAGVAPIRQFQIVQKTLEDLLLRLVVLGPLSVVEEDDLCSRVRAIFGDYFRVQIDYCDRIERDPTGKYRDFICEV